VDHRILLPFSLRGPSFGGRFRPGICLALCVVVLAASVATGQQSLPWGLGTADRLSYGLRVGTLVARTSLDGRPSLQLAGLGRYRYDKRVLFEVGLGYGRLTTSDAFRGARENFSTELGLISLKALVRPFAGGTWAARHSHWRLHLFGGIGALRYDIDELTPRRGASSPIGWTGQVPLGLGCEYSLGEAALVAEMGYTFTFSNALDEVSAGGKDNFLGVTLALVFSRETVPSLVHRTVEVPQLSSLKRSDRDQDGLDEREETRVYFTNPLMADSDNDGLSDGREVKELGTDPNRADSDGGGTGDGIEVESGLDPLDPSDDVLVVDEVPENPVTPAESGRDVVFFGSGGTRLDVEALRVIDYLVLRLQQWPELKVGLYGYSDSVGGASANMRLSWRRAETVRNALVRQGIALDRLRLVARGEADPIAPNDTASGRGRNRRVEVKPLPSGSSDR
jgi:outer membrane protein OmpA-like peptidoglycan-associated protein